MSATPVTTIPNRPAGKPVFDFAIGDSLCRVVLTTTSNDGETLHMTGWAYLIDTAGKPVLDAATAAPVATTDVPKTVALSGVMAGTHCLYDDWVRYTANPVDAGSLPQGWTSGAGEPTGTPAYGSGYYDTAAERGYVYAQGCFNVIGESLANALAAQIDTAAKLTALGL